MIPQKTRNSIYPVTDRRGFLKGVVGGAAALSIVPSLDAAESEAKYLRIPAELKKAGTVGESYWRFVKEQFTIKPKLIMLNAANLCPTSRIVRDAASRLMEDLESDVSFQNRDKFDALREAARQKLAALMGASEDEIAIVRNTSEANNLIGAGLGLKAGDEVVIFDQNHYTNNVAWDVRAARIGFIVKRVSLPIPPDSTEEILQAFQVAMSSKTKVLSFSHVSNATGVRLPAKELCRMARERGIYVHVDGAQTFGALLVNLHEMGCDSYSGSAHKWLLGPKEAGLLYVRQERIAEMWPSIVGLGWGTKAETALRGARKFETLGQRNDGTVSAMGTAVDVLNAIGPARIQARILELSALLKEDVRKIPKAKLRTPTNPDLSAGVCSFEFEEMDNHKIYESLYTKHGIAGAATGGVRLCPHIYNTHEEIEHAVSALRQITKEM